MTVGDALREATARLMPVSNSPALDAELLCCYAYGVNRSAILARGSEELPQQTQEVFALVVQQRLDGMPIAYIRGEQEFYGRSFAVNRSVLIPRPETELLVEAVKKHCSNAASLRILDIGTGSGCIAVTLAIELPDAQVVASDIDPEALMVAQRNAERLGATVEFRRGDCYAACADGERFDVIVSNPPYVPVERIAAASPEAEGLRYEPVHALTPLNGAHTSIVETIITQAPRWLAPKGLLVIEIGEDMGQQALQWAHAAFPERRVEIQQEWSGADRVLVVQ